MAKVNKERVKQLIKKNLAGILHKSTNNRKFTGVTIVDVKVSPDTSSAIIYYSVFQSKNEVTEITDALNSAAGFLQSKLSKTIKTRNSPKLKFVFDGGFDQTDRVEQLLKQIQQGKPPEQ